MTETREFPTTVVVSISTATMLASTFSEVHGFAEFLMGHPIWTHHFANTELWDDMRKTLQAQHPDLPSAAPDVTKGNWREQLESKFGKTLRIRKGSGLTAMLPTDRLREDAIVIGVDK